MAKRGKRISETKYPCSRAECLVPINGGTIITELAFRGEWEMYHKECAPKNAITIEMADKKRKKETTKP